MKYKRQFFPELEWQSRNIKFSCGIKKDRQLTLDEVPIVQFFEKSGGRGHFLLLGEEGGCSKTSYLELLRLHLQKKSSTSSEKGNKTKYIYYYYDLKKQNDNSRAKDDRVRILSDIKKILKNRNSQDRVCVIFDSFDEIRGVDEMENVNLLLQGKDDNEKNIFNINDIDFYIIGTRIAPRFCLRKRSNRDVHFKDFQILDILPFSENQISIILPEVRANVENRELLKLLRTPFFVLCYCDIISENSFSELEVINETTLIKQYLEYQCKKKKQSRDVRSEDKIIVKCYDFIYKVGEAIFNSKENSCVVDWDDDFPVKALNRIVIREEGDRIIPYFSHVKFQNYCLAVYLKKEFVKGNYSFFKYGRLTRESLYYLGQIIRNDSIKGINSSSQGLLAGSQSLSDESLKTQDVLTALNGQSEFFLQRNIKYALFNILYVILGFTAGVIDEKIINNKKLFQIAWDEGWLNNNYVTKMGIPDYVTKIETETFNRCTSLTKVFIPKSLSTIAHGAFVGCISLQSIIVDPNNDKYCSLNDDLYSKNQKKLISYAKGKSQKSFVVSNAVIEICKDAFRNSLFLEEVIISYNVSKIGSKAFKGCASLNNVNISDSITAIEKNTFMGCISLKKIIIPSSVSVIREGAFRGCSSLCSVQFPQNIEIQYRAFSNCSALTEVIFQEKIKLIETCAFENCFALKQITYKGSFEQWIKIEKEPCWNKKTSDYIIKCSDRDVLKNIDKYFRIIL